MLDTDGKIMERLICNRLEEAIDVAGGLAKHQYGFRKGCSTIDAIREVVDTAAAAIAGSRWKRGAKKYCAIVTLDIKNAFNTAKWSCILNALTKFKVPSYLTKIVMNYFENRILCYSTDKGPMKYNVTGGVPQGSVLGPILWNMMYDDIFRLNIPNEAKIVGFADDIAVVVVAKHKEEIVQISNETVTVIQDWLSTVGLELASHKTEALLISSRKQRETISLQVGDCNIISQPVIRYLGIYLDARLTFKNHLNVIAEKGSKTQNALARILPNTGGATQKRRMLLSSVISSIMLYGAPIWAEKANTKTYKKRMGSVYRSSALRVICGFRTISDDAACVVAGMAPVDICANERKEMFDGRHSLHYGEVRESVRKKSLQVWQRRWNASTKGRWTFRLIPCIDAWVNRRHGEVNFYMSQFLTGHGCFRSYLHKYKHDDSPYCPSCSLKVENVEHVLFECPRFQYSRIRMKNSLGYDVSPENVVDRMMESQERWNAVDEFICVVMKELRRLERARSDNRA